LTSPSKGGVVSQETQLRCEVWSIAEVGPHTTSVRARRLRPASQEGSAQAAHLVCHRIHRPGPPFRSADLAVVVNNQPLNRGAPSRQRSSPAWAGCTLFIGFTPHVCCDQQRTHAKVLAQAPWPPAQFPCASHGTRAIPLRSSLLTDRAPRPRIARSPGDAVGGQGTVVTESVLLDSAPRAHSHEAEPIAMAGECAAGLNYESTSTHGGACEATIHGTPTARPRHAHGTPTARPRHAHGTPTARPRHAHGTRTTRPRHAILRDQVPQVV
jgi:hypothetical protein